MTSKRMTRAEMIRWLGDAISTETEKPFEEIDYDFVDECGCLLDELMGKSAAMSEKEIAERIEQLKPDTTSVVRKKNVSRKFWKIAVAAAIVLCMSVTVMAVPVWRQAILKVLQFNVGESINENGITYINAGELIVYSDMDELIATERLDILSYKDPDGELLITEISHISDISTTIISFNDPSINFSIEHDIDLISESIKNKSEKFSTSYFDSYIMNVVNKDVTEYISYFIFNNNTYNIKCLDKDTLISILNSLYPGEN